MAELSDVLVLGGIFREIHQAPPKQELRLAGSGLTAALAASHLGARATIAGYVGDEDFEIVSGLLREAGTDFGSLIRLAGASGTFVFADTQDPARPWPLYRPAEATPTAPPASLPGARVCVAFGIPDYDPAAEGWLDTLPSDSTLLWDRQGWLSRARDSSKVGTLPPHRKFRLVNEAEALLEAGTDDLAEAIAQEPLEGFNASVIKRGGQGVLLIEDGAPPVAVPGFPVHVHSTIGSGDVFAGALAARLSAGDSLSAAAKWANAAASLALTSGAGQLPKNAFEQVRRMALR